MIRILSKQYGKLRRGVLKINRFYWFLLIFSLTLSSAIFSLLYTFDENFDVATNLFTFSGALSSALIGGFVAFNVANLQIKANNNNEKYKELKKEHTALLIAITDLKIITRRLDRCTENTLSAELSENIDVDFLSNFKNEFLYLLTDEESRKYCSVLNRLKILKGNSTTNNIDLQKVLSLSDNVKKVINNFEEQEKVLKESKNQMNPSSND